MKDSRKTIQQNKYSEIPVINSTQNNAGKHNSSSGGGKKWNFDLLRKIVKYCKGTADVCYFTPLKNSKHLNGDDGGSSSGGNSFGLGCGIRIFEIPKVKKYSIKNTESESWNWFPNN